MLAIIRSFIFYILFFPMMTSWSFIGGFYHFCTGKYCFWVVRRYGADTLKLLKIINGIDSEFHSKINSLEKPLLIISNHVSALDTMLLPLYFKQNDMTYVVKKSLVQWKAFPFNLGCKAMGAIPVSREANAGDFAWMLEQIKLKMEQNTSVVLFPNGTRNTNIEDSIEIPPTGALIAKKLKLDILPVFMGTDTWGNGKLFKDIGLIKKKNICVYVGSPITTNASSVKDIHKEVLSFFNQSINTFKTNNAEKA